MQLNSHHEINVYIPVYLFSLIVVVDENQGDTDRKLLVTVGPGKQ